MSEIETSPRQPWYALSVTESLDALKVDPQQGLSTAEVQARQARYGKNELPAEEGTSLLAMIVEQFRDVTVILLIIASIISIFLGEWEDSVVILIIVFLNAVIGVYQERQAENALAALSKLQTPVVRVRRGGAVRQISALDLVPGDIVLLEAGDRVPADGRLITAVNVKVDEAMMTGESLPVEKDTQPLPLSETSPALADRHNVLYMGTALTYGRAELLVTETGLQTQIGNIATLIQNVEEIQTPLQERLDKMGYILAGGAVTICIIVFIAGVLRGEAWNEMFLTSVSLAVAAVPEGLPAIVTVVLALGAGRMAKRNALIRTLPAVETLGSVTTICSDKTGTLTRNEMTATHIVIPSMTPIHVTGVGYAPQGAFQREGAPFQPTEDRRLRLLLEGGALCSTAFLEQKEGVWHIVGDTTEGALLVLAQKAGLSREALEKTLPRVAEIPFTSERKAMTTLHSVPQAEQDTYGGAVVAFVKGAPDALVSWACAELAEDGQTHLPLHAERRAAWQAAIDEMARGGMRVLGLAYRLFEAVPAVLTPESVERDLILLGLVGIIDPPRAEATQAVKIAKGAGIRPMMITGDHKLTAQAIAAEVGISPYFDAPVLEGAELDKLSPSALHETVKTVSVYARVSPEHKLRIVEALQANGEIAAMTGDGVNDAPALKQANIGVAMGITGTDVSKGASDMVLTDDNFASIVSAVEEGRTIYDNIRKFISYLMGSNLGEIISMFGAIMLGLKLPLLATQILWVNLVTDGLPAIALGFEKGEKGVMHRPPRHPKESIFARGIGLHIVWSGLWMGGITLLGYVYALNMHGGELLSPSEENLTLARSMAFFILSMTQIFHVIAIHAGNASLFEAPFWQNRVLVAAIISTTFLQFAAIYLPFMQGVLDTAPLHADDLLVALALAASIIPAVEMEKALWRAQGRKIAETLAQA